MKVNVIDPGKRKDRMRYLDVPFNLSRNQPDWLPAPRSSTAFDLSQRHPFYQHSTAAFFTVGPSSQPAGRIAVMDNRNYNTHRKTRQAFFSHFECENNPDTAECLVQSAMEWAARRGLNQLVGPVGFLQTDARGMMISGHGQITSFALPYSPPYYADLMDSTGFRKKHDYLSGELHSDFRINARVQKIALRMMERTRTTLRHGTSRKALKKMAPRLLDVYKQSGTGAPLYYPLTEDEESCIISRLHTSIHPRLIHWMESEGNVCGIQMTTPNYAEAFRGASTGTIARLGAFLRQRKHPDVVNISTTYIIPAFQGSGLLLVLNQACQEAAVKLNIQKALVGPVYESNAGILSVYDKMDIDFNIVHRLFEKETE